MRKLKSGEKINEIISQFDNEIIFQPDRFLKPVGFVFLMSLDINVPKSDPTRKPKALFYSSEGTNYIVELDFSPVEKKMKTCRKFSKLSNYQID